MTPPHAAILVDLVVFDDDGPAHPLAMLFLPFHARPLSGRGVPVVCPDCGLRQMTGEAVWQSGCCQAARNVMPPGTEILRSTYETDKRQGWPAP